MHMIDLMVAWAPTSVRGTFRVNPEVATSLSGGAFSNHFPRPAYQNVSVCSYLQSIGCEYSGFIIRNIAQLTDTYCSATGRGYSDFSAQAMNFQALVNGPVVIVPLRVFPGSCSSTYCGINVRPSSASGGILVMIGGFIPTCCRVMQRAATIGWKFLPQNVQQLHLNRERTFSHHP